METIQVIVFMHKDFDNIISQALEQSTFIVSLANKSYIGYLIEYFQRHFLTNFIFVCNSENK